MATGVLVLGIGRATRLLGHLSGCDKTYEATIRLGETTVTDDAEGEVVARTSASGVTEEQVRTGVLALTGQIEQVPSSVSAIKVNGQRSYARVRAGEQVALAARPVTVRRFDVLSFRRPADAPDVVDVDVEVSCSSGTYIRALARDLGVALGVGGHLTMLRRTRVGAFGIDQALTLDQLAESLRVVPLGEAASASFPCRRVSAEEAAVVGHGGRLPALGQGPGPIAVLDPEGTLIALVEECEGVAKSLAVFVG
jgi:tRNA pseudouridine55 synthase